MNIFKRKSQAATFEQDTEGLSNEEIRNMELQRLQPERLQKPVCADACADTPLNRYVKVYFSSPAQLEEFEKYVTVRHITERTTTDTAKIVEALRRQHDSEQPTEENLSSPSADTQEDK